MFPEEGWGDEPHYYKFPLSKSVQLTAAHFMEDVIGVCLDFQPKFYLRNQEYTFLDAFASEISSVVKSIQLPPQHPHICVFLMVLVIIVEGFYSYLADLEHKKSQQVTRAYGNYKALIGRRVEGFPSQMRQMRHETDNLIMIDDILGEMTMIQRVYHDQSWILSQMGSGIKSAGSRRRDHDGYNIDNSEVCDYTLKGH